MKRLWITLLVVAMASIIAIPAGAGKPDCAVEPDHASCKTDDTTPTTVPELQDVVVCYFNGDGVLIDSAGGDPVELSKANSGIRCKLTADDPADSFTFVISGDATLVSFPYIAVTDRYPNGGNTCFHDYVRGRTTNPNDDGTEFEFAAFETGGALDSYQAPGDAPHDGRCGPRDDTDGADTYALTFQVQKTSGGTVHLTMTQG